MNAAAPSEGKIYAAVCKSWAETLPLVAFDPEASWAETGADSLETLHLVLRLERALGRRIPLDLVTPDVTPPTLARLLARESVSAPFAPATTPVLLIPGAFGDDVSLLRFRRSFAGVVDFELLDLPDLGEPVAVLLDVAATGRVVAGEIVRRRPEGPILLAGYSFGGNVAYEAARELLALGRDVRFVGLLDPRSPGDPRATGGKWRLRRRAHWAMQMLARQGESWRSHMLWLRLLWLVRRGRLEPARRLVLAATPELEPQPLLRMQHYLVGRGRAAALASWRPLPLDVPMLLAASAEYQGMGSLERWGRVCPRIDMIVLPTTHNHLFAPLALETLTPAFLAAVARVRSKDEEAAAL
jgi:thioesterase domain-containing protein/acyl carrier protein